MKHLLKLIVYKENGATLWKNIVEISKTAEQDLENIISYFRNIEITNILC